MNSAIRELMFVLCDPKDILFSFDIFVLRTDGRLKIRSQPLCSKTKFLLTNIGRMSYTDTTRRRRDNYRRNQIFRYIGRRHPIMGTVRTEKKKKRSPKKEEKYWKNIINRVQRPGSKEEKKYRV